MSWRQKIDLLQFEYKDAWYRISITHGPSGSVLNYERAVENEKGLLVFRFIDEDEFVTAHRIATRCWERNYHPKPGIIIDYDKEKFKASGSQTT